MNVSFWLVLWAAAVVIAAVASRRRDGSGRPYLPITFAWLAALGLVLTLFGRIVPGWAWLAWIIALVAVVLARYKVAAAFVAVAAGLALVGGLVGAFAPRPSPARAPASAAIQPPAASPQTTGTPPAACDPRFAQSWDPNERSRFASSGLWDDPQAQTVSLSGATQRQAALAARDARYLAAAAWSVKLWDDPNRVDPLLTTDKACLSSEGIVLYDTLVAKWASAQAAIGEAPATGFNTGSNGGTFVVNATNGVTGNRSAIVRTYSDGSRSYDLIRCANFVLPAAPKSVPTGRTDQEAPKPARSIPPPATTHPRTPPPSIPPPSSPPPATTPPLQPKNPADSKPGPSGKPLAPPPSGPAETTPPVEPNPAQPATTPGAAAPSTVTAPEATPAPQQTTPPPSPVPQAPPPSDPGTFVPDPDGSPAAGFALPLLGLGALARRRLNR